MLSSQTKDTTNAIAMRRLQSELPHPGLTLTNILAVEPEKLNDMIYVVGFHNNKTRYIKAAVLILRDQFGGDIPDTIEGLMSLPVSWSFCTVLPSLALGFASCKAS